MDTPDVTTAQKGALAQLVAAVAAAAALGLTQTEFVAVVVCATVLGAVTVLADGRIRAARNHRAAIERATAPDELADDEVASDAEIAGTLDATDAAGER